MIEHFAPASSVLLYSKRFGENGSFSLPKVKIFGEKSLVYLRCILWNELSNRIKQVQYFDNF